MEVNAVHHFVMTNKWKVEVPPQVQPLVLPQSSSADSSRRSYGTSSQGEEEEGEGAGKKEASQFNFELQTEHCIQERQGQKAFRCDVCDGTYRHAFSLKRHFLRSHVNYIYLSSSDISNCNINLSAEEEACREEFIRRYKNCAAAGQPLPAKTELYRCNTCTQLFDQLEDLKYHIANHPNNQTAKRFSCAQCNMTFSHKQNLVRHLSVHSGEKPYTCKHCGKGFPTATNQRRHERIHEGHKPYICPHCLSNFSQSGDLKKHIRKLHGEFFHPCAFCLKYFSTEKDLKQHCLSHGKTLELNYRELKKKMGEQRTLPAVSTAGNELHFVCIGCKRRFGTSVALNRHKRLCVMRSIQRQEQNSYSPEETVTQKNGIFVPSRYFSSISENIAANLQDHVDGKISHLTKAQGLAAAASAQVAMETDSTDWRRYNFPPEFAELGFLDFCSKSEETSPLNEEKELNKSDDEVLENYSEDALDLSMNTSLPPPKIPLDHIDPLTDHDEMSGGSLMVYMCYACGERFQSLSDINEHKVNNHPNVYCTHLELESSKGAPLELFQYHCSPVGILQKCQVLSSSSLNTQLQCTKCQGMFIGTVELHNHILVCGGTNAEDEEVEDRKQQSSPQVFKRGIKRSFEEDEPVKLRRSCVLRKDRLTFPKGQVKRCMFCGSLFTNALALERHQKLCQHRSPSKSAHRCHYCSRTFNCAATLKKHVLDVCLPFVRRKKKPNLAFVGAGKKLKKKTQMAATQHRKVLAEKFLKEKKIKLTRHVSILNPEVLKKPVSAPPVETPPLITTEQPKYVEVEETREIVEEKEELINETVETPAEIIEEEEATPQVAEIPVEVEEFEEKVVVKVEEEEEEDEIVEEIAEKMEVASQEEALDQSQVSENCSEAEKEQVSIKVESDLVSKEQQHTCPSCKRTFTYLANFKKHLNHLCPLRQPQVKQEDSSSQATDVTGTEGANSDSNKENNEKDESKAGKLDGKEHDSPTRGAKTSPQCCNICHKTFSSYLVMLKHRLSHKLKMSDHRDDAKEIVQKVVKRRVKVLRGGRRRRRAATRQLRGKKIVISSQKAISKRKETKDIQEEDEEEEEEEEEEEMEEVEEHSELGENELNEQCDEPEPEEEEKEPVKIEVSETGNQTITRSKTAFSVKDGGGIKYAQISEYRKTILRKVNESFS